VTRIALRVAPRYESPAWLAPAVLGGSVVAGLAAVGLLFAASGANPFYAFFRIFSGSFGSVYGLGETVTKAIPLILIASGLAVVFRAKFWNIGAESQLLLGATFAGWVGLHWQAPAPLLVAGMFAAGFAGGALWGLVPAVLRTRFGVNEVISTLMLNYIASELLTLLVTGPWKGRTQQGFPYTDDLPAAATLAVIPGTRIHVVTLLLAFAAAAALFVLVRSTKFGYELRVIGENREAARYAGIDLSRVTVLMMLLSGGVAGLAGAGEVAGVHHHLTYPLAISSGYGYTAIIVAWLAKLNPLASVVAGFFFAGILVGGDAIQISLGLPAATVQVFNGMLLVCLIAGDYFARHTVTLVVARRDR
jgi:general nucleoside transport system permease protein